MSTIIEFIFLDGQKQEFAMNKDLITIGRGTTCDIVLPFDGISRKHAEFEIKDGGVFVTDLGSTNGILIDGIKIPPKTKVPYQTFLNLQFGPFQSVVFHLKREMTSVIQVSALQGVPKKSPVGENTAPFELPALGSTKIVKPGLRVRPQSSKKKETNNFLPSVLLILAIVGGAVYYQFFRGQPSTELGQQGKVEKVKPAPVESEFITKEGLQNLMGQISCREAKASICKSLLLNPEGGEGVALVGPSVIALVDMNPYEKKPASKEFTDFISTDRYEIYLLEHIQKSSAVAFISRHPEYTNLQLVGFLSKERTPLMNLKMNKDLSRRYMDPDIIGSLVDEARSLGILKSFEAIRPEYKIKEY